jgi:hypothetical protein
MAETIPSFWLTDTHILSQTYIYIYSYICSTSQTNIFRIVTPLHLSTTMTMIDLLKDKYQKVTKKITKGSAVPVPVPVQRGRLCHLFDSKDGHRGLKNNTK